MLHSRGSNHNFYSLFVNLSTLLSCIELEIHNIWLTPKHFFSGDQVKEDDIKALQQIGSMVLLCRNKINHCGDTPFQTFVKFAVELVAL